ncbi:MAG: hypothetical protein SGJ18_01890 [Pseudomonadota bacterium]|nr:hypothetical protein [Pseudomonadota bacterium]
MKKPKDIATNAILVSVFLFCLGCGVRGNPVPLNQPPTLGRGRPTYDQGMDELLKKQGLTEKEKAEDKTEDDVQKKTKKH